MSALMNECKHGADDNWEDRATKAEALVERLRETIASLHFHHKVFEPDCRHCQKAHAEIFDVKS